MTRVIVTGGPGVGKTTLPKKLEALGYATETESARALIRERLAAGLPPRPGRRAFAAEVLRRDQAKYQLSLGRATTTFFDRSAVEAVGMAQEAGAISAAEVTVLLSALKFHPTVFILPPWQDIYVNDAERDHDYAHCVAVHNELARWYAACGYHLHEVPRLRPAERAAHVLRALGEGGA